MTKSFRSLKWYEWVMLALLIVIAGRAMVLAFVNPSASSNPAWLTIVNFVSAICGAICIFFTAKANINNFIFGTLNTLVYMVYLWYWKIYGTFFLEALVYLPVDILSWIFWAKHRDADDRNITMTKKLTWQQDTIVLTVVAVSAIIYHAILVKVGGTVPWLDAFTVAIGVVAVFLELFRYREQYALWIVSDFIAVAMYIIHFDPVYLTKKSIYLVMAFVGLYNWWKLNKIKNPNNI